MLALLLVLLGSSRASADPRRDPAAAERFFQQGRAALSRKEFGIACPAFEQSLALDPTTGTLLNLAECNALLGRTATAWQGFVDALRQLASDDPRRDYTQKRIDALAAQLANVVVVVNGSAPRSGVRVTKDGVELGAAAFGVPLPVDPGPVSFIVTAPGREDAQYSVVARPGQTSRIVVGPGAPAIATSPTTGTTSPPPSPTHSSGDRTLGFVVGGVGLAVTLTGAITGLMALSQASQYRSDCPGPGTACPSTAALSAANNAASSAHTLSTISTVGWIVGAAGVGAGIYLVVRPPSKSSRTAGSAVGLSPLAAGGATGAMAVWQGSF